MNNGVNDTNNLNNQNNVNGNINNTNMASPTIAQQQANTSVVTVQTPVSPVISTPTEIENPNAALQTIPGVVVAPPQNNGMYKPNPIQPLPVNQEVATTPVASVELQPSQSTGQSIDNSIVPDKNKIKKKSKLPIFLILIIVILIGVIVFLMYNHKMEVQRLNYECTPVSTTKDAK